MQFNNSTLGNGQGGTKYPKGVFVDLVTITKAENAESQYNDCNIFVEGESPMAKYPKKFYLGGKHHKDGKGTLLDWGSGKNDTPNGSWKISAFIEAVTGKSAKEINLTDKGHVAEDELKNLIGKKVHILQYESNGKYSRDTWFYFGEENGGKEFLLEKWESMTPPKSYKHQSSNTGLNTLWNEGESQVDKAKKDVELPF